MLECPVMNEAQPWKESVRRALSKASDQRQIARIAREMKLDAGRLHQFVSKGYLNADAVKQVEEWLMQNGYLEAAGNGMAPQNADQEPDYVSLVVREMEGVLAVLKDPAVPKKLKGNRLRSFITDYYLGLQDATFPEEKEGQ